MTAEELARLAGVKATTVRKTAKELLELLKHDMDAAEWERTAATMEKDGLTEEEGVGWTGGLFRSRLRRNFLAGVAAESSVPRGLVASAHVTVDAPASSVWDAFVNPETIRKYAFGVEVESDWRKGSSIRWKGISKGMAYEDRGTVLDVEEGRRLSYSHFSTTTRLPDAPENYHHITIDLGRDGGLTTIVLTQDNNPDDEARERSRRSWESTLQELKRLLEAH